MSDTLKAYQSNQEKMVDILEKLNEFIKQGNRFGLSLPEEMYSKLANVSKDLRTEKLKIALVGGFSEGKTSIAAAWLGKLDKSSMKISAAESSNEVKVYNIDDDYVLIDTPGLYGYKEQENDAHEIEKYKDITKKYVSEAHIILYVMNSKNPIKESHKDDLVWLFKDLGLLNRTVFVLSRFDEVADVEDEQEYKHYLNIKTENVKSRLKEFLELSSQDLQELKIVGISANPFDEGVEYWLNNPKEFEQLSHIGSLQNATKEIVQHGGGLNEIVNETRKTVFNDIMLQEIPKIEQKNREIIKHSDELNHIYTLQSGELGQLKKRIESARHNIKTQINSYFQDLLSQASGLGMHTAQAFFENSVGKEGALITSRINQIFFNETAAISSTLNTQIIQFDANIESIDSYAVQAMKQGITRLTNIKLDNKTVLKARNAIQSATKMVGVDVSKMLKFKTHGAVKLANNLNGIFAMVGLAMEAYDSYSKHQAEQKFKEDISAFKEDLQNQQKEILHMVDSSDFIPTFFQGYLELENAVNNIKNQRQQQQEEQDAFESWKAQGKTIEAEFREIC